MYASTYSDSSPPLSLSLSVCLLQERHTPYVQHGHKCFVNRSECHLVLRRDQQLFTPRGGTPGEQGSNIITRYRALFINLFDKYPLYICILYIILYIYIVHNQYYMLNMFQNKCCFSFFRNFRFPEIGRKHDFTPNALILKA